MLGIVARRRVRSGRRPSGADSGPPRGGHARMRGRVLHCRLPAGAPRFDEGEERNSELPRSAASQTARSVAQGYSFSFLCRQDGGMNIERMALELGQEWEAPARPARRGRGLARLSSAVDPRFGRGPRLHHVSAGEAARLVVDLDQAGACFRHRLSSLASRRQNAIPSLAIAHAVSCVITRACATRLARAASVRSSRGTPRPRQFRA